MIERFLTSDRFQRQTVELTIAREELVDLLLDMDELSEEDRERRLKNPTWLPDLSQQVTVKRDGRQRRYQFYVADLHLLMRRVLREGTQRTELTLPETLPVAAGSFAAPPPPPAIER